MVSFALTGSMLKGAYVDDVTYQHKIIDGIVSGNKFYSDKSGSYSVSHNSVTFNNDAQIYYVV